MTKKGMPRCFTATRFRGGHAGETVFHAGDHVCKHLAERDNAETPTPSSCKHHSRTLDLGPRPSIRMRATFPSFIFRWVVQPHSTIDTNIVYIGEYAKAFRGSKLFNAPPSSRLLIRRSESVSWLFVFTQWYSSWWYSLLCRSCCRSEASFFR